MKKKLIQHKGIWKESYMVYACNQAIIADPRKIVIGREHISCKNCRRLES